MKLLFATDILAVPHCILHLLYQYGLSKRTASFIEPRLDSVLRPNAKPCAICTMYLSFIYICPIPKANTHLGPLSARFTCSILKYIWCISWNLPTCWQQDQSCSWIYHITISDPTVLSSLFLQAQWWTRPRVLMPYLHWWKQFIETARVSHSEPQWPSWFTRPCFGSVVKCRRG